MRAVAIRKDIRDGILDAADRLLAHYGYKKMTIDDLAQEVGIGKGTIYLHFTSKEEVVLSHIDRIIHRLKGELQTIAHSEASGASRLRQMLITRVLFRFDSVQHYTESISDLLAVQHYTESISDLLAAIRPALLARRAHYFDEEAMIFAEVLKDGARANSLSKVRSQLPRHYCWQQNPCCPIASVRG